MNDSPELVTIIALTRRAEQAERLVEEVAAILESAPELNPSNYDHEQVCELNAKVVEAVLAMRARGHRQKGDTIPAQAAALAAAWKRYVDLFKSAVMRESVRRKVRDKEEV